jgi:hypothetical protein
MVSEKLARFLDQEANVGAAGTRDGRLVPHVHRVSGWRVGPDRKTLTVLLPEVGRPHLEESLADNGQFAFTCEAFPSHETYQFKGQARVIRPADDTDRQVADRVRDRWIRGTRTLFGPEAEPFMRAFLGEPAIAVELQVEEIFLQTPGPSAGKRVFPPAEG